MECGTPTLCAGRGRRKQKAKPSWKKEILKRDRRKSKGFPIKPTCEHKKKIFQCGNLPMQDVRRFHEAFYSNTDKISQDNFILKYTSQSIPKRRRPGCKDGPSKTITICYYIKSNSLGIVQVCGKAFLGILRVSKFRVQNIAKQHHISGQSPKERRGGDTRSKKYIEKKNEVRKFLQSLHCVESHYTREHSIREYFPSDWNVRKLWTAYNTQVQAPMQVKYHFFWDIFMNDFNISFKTPATDACSECIRLKAQIKLLKDDDEKTNVMAKYTVHKMRAKAFHKLLKNKVAGTFKFSFDCQKNLVLPKVPDQTAYYSRQLYQYNMTICEGHSKNTQTTETVNIFTWSEDQRFKGSNEIASIVYYYLCQADLCEFEKVQMFSDGCPGQNKNITMIGMLSKWLLESAPPNIQSLDFIFPVVGHSYIPPDRVFGRIEKVLKKKDTIIEPQEYLDIFSKYGTVKIVGKDVPVFDFKSSVAANVKAPGQLHFQFAPAKRITLLKKKNTVVIKGETTYNSDLGCFKPFLKKGKTFHFKPSELPNQVSVKPEKIQDVKKLLTQHFGNWEAQDGLEYYKQVLLREEAPNFEEAEQDAEFPIEDDSLHV